MLAMSWDAIQIKKTGLQMRVDDVAGTIRQPNPALPRSAASMVSELDSVMK